MSLQATGTGKRRLLAEMERRGLLRQTVTKPEERTERWHEYLPVTPFDKQLEFLRHPARFKLYGGAAGGGKTAALLMFLLEPVTVPGYRGVAVRRNRELLKASGGLIDLAQAWLAGTDAKWDGHRVRFPSGASVEFIYCDSERDLKWFRGPGWQRMAFDEATEFPWEWMQASFSRLRAPDGFPVRPQWAAGTNPGGKSHIELRTRFVESTDPDFWFIRATLEDNPHIDREDYLKSLEHLDPVTRAQMLNGDWYATVKGKYASPELFELVDEVEVPPHAHSVRWWDVALTGRDDAVGSVRMTYRDGIFWVLDATKDMLSSPQIKDRVAQKALEDPRGTVVALEKKPVSLPTFMELELVDTFEPLDWNKEHEFAAMIGAVARPEPLGKQRYRFMLVPQYGDKLVRCSGFLDALHRGAVRLVKGHWNQTFIDEFCRFTNTAKDSDELVDCAGGCHQVCLRFPDVAPLAAPRRVLPGSREELREAARRQARAG